MSVVTSRTIAALGADRGIPPLGFGCFKIGRNQGTKYPHAYELPDEQTVSRLLHGVLDLGCNLIDTAPAYGLSEERIGRAISGRRNEYILSTKVGETFEDNRSTFDFSENAVRGSLNRSMERLCTDVIDVVFIHSNGDDKCILMETPVVSVLQEFKSKGQIKAIGLSGKTIEGTRLALEWADALMIELNLNNRTHESIIAEAAQRGVAVFVKKGLLSGHLPPAESIRFVLGVQGVTSLIVGGLNLEHFAENWRVAMDLGTGRG